MARPLKQGLDYFSLDVDFFQDFKIRKIIRACGISATPVIISLLSRIYGNHGYYMEWDAEMPFLIADDVGISEGAVTEIVKKAIQVDFFNANMFETHKILTSHGIQKRFLASTSKRKQVSMHRDFLLVGVSSARNLVINGRNPPETELLTPETDKVKESKVKQSIEDRAPAGVDVLLRQYAGNDTSLLNALQKFARTRKALGRPLMGKDVPGLLSDLAILSDDDRERKIQIINQSSERKWERFYRLKNQKTAKKDNTQKIITDDAVWNNIKGW